MSRAALALAILVSNSSSMTTFLDRLRLSKSVKMIIFSGCLHDTWATFARCEFTLIPFYGSIFVYVISPQNVMPARVTPVVVPGREFHSGMKFGTGIMYTQKITRFGVAHL